MEDGRPAHREQLLVKAAKNDARAAKNDARAAKNDARSAEDKVPGGKLVRVAVSGDGRVRISGDFFVHPEESLCLLEAVLGQMKGSEPEREIAAILSQIVTVTGIELIGLDVPTIARLYKRCLSCGE
jgi:lipoate-protein ligase A